MCRNVDTETPGVNTSLVKSLWRYIVVSNTTLVIHTNIYIYIYIYKMYAQYTGTVKLTVFIIFQTVRYHNFAQFGISYAAVPKFRVFLKSLRIR